MGRKKKYPNPFEDEEFLKLVEECHKLRDWYFNVCEPMFQQKELEERKKLNPKKSFRQRAEE